MTSRLEILAPGGSPLAVASALAAGADAVYVGADGLNARARAQNLAMEQIPAMAAYVHSKGAKLYLALNVPLNSQNLDAAINTLAMACLSGVDAVIMRDQWLMSFVSQYLPQLAIHASTQFGVLDSAGARRARNLGASRVILGRECSLDDIRQIHKDLPELELEVFVLGAMCFGISGRCLLGEFVSGRSGNYGNCAQICRLEFFSEEGRNLGRIFSMKDQNLLPRLAELVEAGVCCVKIEGRMKSPAWVGTATSLAKAWMLKDTPGGQDSIDRLGNELAALFSRSTGNGFLDGNFHRAQLIQQDGCGHEGLEIHGFRLERHNNQTLLKFITPLPLSIRDGIRILDVRGRESFLSVENLMDWRGRSKKIIEQGMEAVITLSGKMQAARIFIHSCAALEKKYTQGLAIPELSLESAMAKPLFRYFSLEDGMVEFSAAIGRFCFNKKYSLETFPASGGGLDKDGVIRLLGESMLDDCFSWNTQGDIFARPSLLKAIRREFLSDFSKSFFLALEKLTLELKTQAEFHGPKFQDTDSSMSRSRPLCVSRVVGYPAGLVHLPGGRVFRIKPCPGSTTIWRQT